MSWVIFIGCKIPHNRSNPSSVSQPSASQLKTRCRISPAAFRVKVVARMESSGWSVNSNRMAREASWYVLPVPADARIIDGWNHSAGGTPSASTGSTEIRLGTGSVFSKCGRSAKG